ncbi:non-ribosomal peptide synthetase [Robbsia andropogonis]|uniref:non-ribosomal peptide synthetase n=1 Tax=Robbsia andropogonis TaxID=28092 RepID=UPI0004647A46|nr:non-ribosomal peptide synthetase [Robbsia andropogonis]MCP1120892.1 non-ribosomal peptide synthetase [Robbsia andropogonis]MCP1130646.1 non-ribosomal peptide synthetase [Robbsia andropogonis]
MTVFESTMRRFDELHNFGECLRHWSAVKPDDIAFRFLTDGAEALLTFAELDRRADAIAERLRRACPNGEPVLLLYRPGLDFIAAFFGCLYAGCPAVPAYPPSGRAARQNRLAAIIDDCQAAAILTSDDLIDAIREEIAPTNAKSIPTVIGTDTLTTTYGKSAIATLPASPLAFLQYTSGSTGKPKGVRVTHRNLLANEKAIRDGFQHGPDTVFVGWCPLYHDMGLIGNVLQPVYLGIPSTLMSPFEFLQQPVKWLRAISTYRATTSGGPNFAYEFCATRISEADKAGLDLSSWRVAFNGAEPVRASTLEKFTSAFADHGFNGNAMFPCYGMAETTLFVSGAKPGGGAVTRRLDAQDLQAGRGSAPKPDQAAVTLVSSGRVGGDQHVRIVDPVTLRACADGRIGEIWVRGGSVADGYWNREADSRAQFDARIVDEDSPPYLRTGDVGLLDGEELYVTGRLKELIIIRGRNHYPTDIEQTVEQSNPAFRAGCGAAFSIDDGVHEKLVVVQEVQRTARHALDADAAARQAAGAVAATHGIPLAELVLVQAGVVPKTSSGKNQRMLVRQSYLDGTLPILARARPESGTAPHADIPQPVALSPVDTVDALTERLLATILGAVQADDARHAKARATPLLGLGFDSLALVDLQVRLAQHAGVAVELADMMDDRPVAVLAADIARRTLHEKTPDAPQALANAAPHARPGTTPGTQRSELTPYQEAIWMAQLWDHASPCFNLALPFRLRNSVSLPLLDEALRTLVSVHRGLSSRFTQDADGNIEQCWIAPSDRLLSVHDVTEVSDTALTARIVALVRQPIDLAVGPVFRAEVLRISPDDVVIVLIAHHLVADLRSLQTVLATLGAAYTQLAEGKALSMAPVEKDYRSRIATLLKSPRAEAGTRYWAERLATPIESVELPLALPGDASMNVHANPASGMSLDVELDDARVAALDALCGHQRVTRNMALMAAFFALLHRYSAQQDLAIVTPVAVRPDGAFDEWVGYGVNLLVMRIAIEAGQSYADVLATTKQSVTGALAHSETPFIDLVRRFGQRSADARHPFSRVMFAYHNLSQLPQAADLLAGAAGKSLQVGGLTMESIPVPTAAAQTDLALIAIQTGERLVLRFEYDIAKLDHATVERMAGHFTTLLDALIARPDEAIGHLGLLTPAERDRQLIDWNRRTIPQPPHATAHAMIDATARRFPERAAVRTDAAQWTYAQLQTASDRIAANLQALGIRHGDVVGIGVPRDVMLPAHLLGIWKAGAAYLPIDLNTPAARVSQMLDDAGVALVVAPATLRDALADAPYACIAPESLTANDMASPARTVSPPADADGLAYVLFTSGSTGRPKGVEISHRNVLSLLSWIGEQYSSDELRAVFAGTSIAFDISTFELFGPLAHGGCVVIGESPMAMPATPVTLINTVPSAAAGLLETGALPSGVRTINLAGEPLRQSLVDALYATGSVERVYDLYGPTEDTVYSTMTLREPGGFDSIGKPLPGKRVYILDANGHPAPVGVAGELFLAGDGQARGYRNRPDLTDRAFVAMPALDGFETRVYRTGDIGRFLPDGRIVLSGRRDHQVKIRGHRVELGEIETALLRHPAIRDTVVVFARQDGAEPRLVAYLAGSGDAGLTVDAVREFAASMLPSYMQPSGYVFLDALPRNASGKVDRAALPPFDPDFAQSAAAPVNETQRAILAIWEEVLGFSGFGIHANLFEIGGHSLQVIRILARCKEAFGVEIPMREVLERATVADLAAYLTLLAARSGAADAPGTDREEILF